MLIILQSLQAVERECGRESPQTCSHVGWPSWVQQPVPRTQGIRGHWEISHTGAEEKTPC